MRPRSRRHFPVLLAALLLFAANHSAAQSALPKVELPAEIKTLVRIKQKMRTSLDKLPNYTCRQRIERTRLNVEANRKTEKKIARHNSPGRIDAYLPLDSADTLELEVALIDHKELYSWPGANHFEERPLSEIVGFGMVGTGDFASHARDLFVNDAARLDYAGEEQLDGRRTLRYDFRVSLFMSRYTISDGTSRATVPYAGSIWADAESADLIRIEVRAEDVPPTLSIADTTTTVDYRTVPLGDGEFLLPASARLITNFRSGRRTINATEFSNCRAFGAESLLSFDETVAAESPESPAARKEFELPPDVSIPVRLDTGIDSGTSVVGGRIQATLTSDLKRNGELLAPKGSLLLGRIRRLERFSDPKDHFILGLEFTELQTPQRHARIAAELVHVTPFRGLVDHLGEEQVSYQTRGGGLAGEGMQRTTVESYSSTPLPGTSELYIRAKRLRIEPGLRMVWRTQHADQ